MQRTRHPAAQTVPGALFSSALLAEKPLSVTLLLEFLCSMRVDTRFPKYKQRLALALLPVTQEGRRRAGALCPVKPGGQPESQGPPGDQQ